MKKIKFDSCRGSEGWYWQAYEDCGNCRCFQISWLRNRKPHWGYYKDLFWFGRLTIFYGRLPF